MFVNPISTDFRLIWIWENCEFYNFSVQMFWDVSRPQSVLTLFHLSVKPVEVRGKMFTNTWYLKFTIHKFFGFQISRKCMWNILFVAVCPIFKLTDFTATRSCSWEAEPFSKKRNFSTVTMLTHFMLRRSCVGPEVFFSACAGPEVVFSAQVLNFFLAHVSSIALTEKS